MPSRTRISFKAFKTSKGWYSCSRYDLKIAAENLLFSNTCNNSRLFIAMYVGEIRVIDNFILY